MRDCGRGFEIFFDFFEFFQHVEVLFENKKADSPKFGKSAFDITILFRLLGRAIYYNGTSLEYQWQAARFRVFQVCRQIFRHQHLQDV